MCETTLPEAGDTKLGGGKVDFLLERIQQFKTEWADRQILQAYEGLTHDLELADYPMHELRKYFRRPDVIHVNEKSAEIFADFVDMQVKAPLEWAKKLDEEYGQDYTENRSI